MSPNYFLLFLSALVSELGDYFKNVTETLLDDSITTQLQNLTENAGEFLSRLTEESDINIKEVLEDVSSLASQKHVAILKTYGVESNVDRSAELGAIGLVVSGLAFVGMLGVAELVTHTGGFIKKRSDPSVLQKRKISDFDLVNHM